SASQFFATAVIMCALFCLVYSTTHSSQEARQSLLERVFLFVCAGNTSRSPMAQAICNGEISRLLGLKRGGIPVKAVRAGLTARPGSPFTDHAVATLRHMDIEHHEHASQNVTAELIKKAEAVFCMTEDQRRQLVERFPASGAKIQRLDPNNDIEDPSGG